MALHQEHTPGKTPGGKYGHVLEAGVEPGLTRHCHQQSTERKAVRCPLSIRFACGQGQLGIVADTQLLRIEQQPGKPLQPIEGIAHPAQAGGHERAHVVIDREKLLCGGKLGRARVASERRHIEQRRWLPRRTPSQEHHQHNAQ